MSHCYDIIFYQITGSINSYFLIKLFRIRYCYLYACGAFVKQTVNSNIYISAVHMI